MPPRAQSAVVPARAPSVIIPPAARIIPIIPVPAPMAAPPMKAWSFSSLMDFETCKFRSYLKRVLKTPEPVRALPPGKTEHANDRGSRIHDRAELFVRGQANFAPEMKPFEPEFISLQRQFKKGKVSLEGEWGMNSGWEPAEWKTAWLRLKLDALVFKSPYEAVAIDYKTGRKFGNEIKHAEQLQLYQVVTFLRYPKLEEVTTELWYLDQDEITSMTFTRNQGLRFKHKWDMRAAKMMGATEFPPNPNIFTCKWCMYGPKGSGVCAVGVM